MCSNKHHSADGIDHFYIMWIRVCFLTRSHCTTTNDRQANQQFFVCWLRHIMTNMANGAVSRSPSPIIIDTPDYIGSDVDNKTQVIFWDDKQYKLLQDHINYHAEMCNTLLALRDNGPFGINLPKKPLKDIKSLLNDSNRKAEPLLGCNLHNYLVLNIVEQNQVSCPLVSEVNPKKFVDVVNYLKKGYEGIKQVNRNTLCAYIDYGNWLNHAYELYYQSHLSGEVMYTWKEFLTNEIGIADSYARKLREIAKLLNNYPQFRTLGLNFSEIYQRRLQIENMLILNHGIAEYWKQPIRST